MLILKALARLVGFLLVLALALLGLGLAGYCLNGAIALGAARPDRVVHLPAVRDQVGHFLGRLQAPGPTASLALAGGVVAVLFGLLLLIGLLRAPRRAEAVLSENRDDGTLAIRRRALRDFVRVLGSRAPGVTEVSRIRLRLARRLSRGHLVLTAARTRTSDPAQVRAAVEEAIAPIAQPLRLRARVDLRLGERGERVQ